MAKKASNRSRSGAERPRPSPPRKGLAAQSPRSSQGKQSNATIASSDKRLIAIRARGGERKLIEHFVMREAASTIVRMAMQWGYILRVRTRWAGDTDMREYFGTRAIKDLDKLGIASKLLQQFALVEHIEIELFEGKAAKGVSDPIVEAAAEIPWEYLLSAATRNVGRFQSLLITRCLSNGFDVEPPPPRRVLFVESAPGRIEQKYDFEDEEKRIIAAVNLTEGDKGLVMARTEPYTKLKAIVASKAWQAIHVTGIDTHQAAWLIDDFYDAVEKVARRDEVIDKKDRLRDGMIIRGDIDSELPIRFDELADLLLTPTQKPHAAQKPYAITLNLYYSGARTARELVRRGAYAALGFLDEIDDEFAERFFQAFYWAWCHDDKLIPDAFLYAWSEMDSDRMHGTAIVIWLGRSMVADSTKAPKRVIRKSAAKRRTGAR